MPHPALLATDHRPWPLPDRSWALTMDWEDLLFLHWRVPGDSLQPHLPAGVEVETFDGTAWLGVVPFRMARTRLRGLPRVPTAHAFPELNVRTYVRCAGRSGVWFFSLDAHSRLAVAGARAAFLLPYRYARMHCARRADEVVFASERRDPAGPPARFAARWRATGEHRTAAPGTLEHWLAERYCMFVGDRGRVRCGEIAHAPWHLAPAAVELGACAVTQQLGLDLSGPPASALAALPQTVAGFFLRRWP
jgi:uncharacterized protein YqjF (DUF2071 family)